MIYRTEIKRATMYEQIADKLEEMILSDHMNVDEKLPSEQSLATGFGVSRPVIREALMLLNARGLISKKNGEGAYISPPSTENFNRTVNRFVKMTDIDLTSLFEVRLVLEVLSAQLAAASRTEEDIQKLRDWVEEMKSDQQDNSKFATDDVAFHAMIASIGKNRMLGMILNSLTEQIAVMIEHNLALEGSNEDTINYHTKIIDAIESGSPEKAADIMRNHIIVSMRNLEQTEKLRANE